RTTRAAPARRGCHATGAEPWTSRSCTGLHEFLLARLEAPHLHQALVAHRYVGVQPHQARDVGDRGLPARLVLVPQAQVVGDAGRIATELHHLLRFEHRAAAAAEGVI